ncbi:hypothetical protein BU14_0272s0018 [Porphyra umbilicalis]|uniref:Glutathione transferase n=1 Tax=Porphyra umbilicalis TaxID=2786 RepID=A0A1X6P1T1_PORUM|nr:hypothetical protein BU14_0272s0018 [Porphyra umbilicalis]|eukprot:OSX74700.1 hypothetical protein BU14_0272s0018 [Porphyra umbilicalis]
MKLLYFAGFRGRAEPIRLALHAGGVDFTDERFAQSEWPSIKPTTPRGAVPTLTLDDGTVLTESLALLRYAGKLGTPRLYPEDAVAAAKVDEAIDILSDLNRTIGATLKLPKEETLAKREAMLAEGGDLTKLLKYVDGMATANGSGFLVGDSLTIADCALSTPCFWLTSGVLDGVPKNCLDKYEGIMKVCKTVSEVPAIKKYETLQYPE